MAEGSSYMAQINAQAATAAASDVPVLLLPLILWPLSYGNYFLDEHLLVQQCVPEEAQRIATCAWLVPAATDAPPARQSYVWKYRGLLLTKPNLLR